MSTSIFLPDHSFARSPAIHTTTRRIAGLLVLLLRISSLQAAINPADWRLSQPLDLPTPGLIKLALPAETLGALRGGAADLRVLDPAGEEVGWFLERPLRFAPDAPVRTPQSFDVTLRPRATVVVVEPGTPLPIGGLALDTGAASFLKAATIEGTVDGTLWTPIAAGVPFYHQYQGESRRETTFVPQVWTQLRITLDDSRSRPIVVTGVRLLVVTTGPTTPLTTQPVRIATRDETPGDTRLTLDFGSANLDIAALRVTTDEGVFARPTSLRIRGLDGGRWVERPITRGLLYRDLTGTNLTGALLPPNVTRLEIGESIPTREAILVIHNGDNPPLPITSIAAELPPVRLVLHARQAGRHQLLMGNPLVAAPHYDLAFFADQFKTAVPVAGVLGPLGPNPKYQPSAVVPDPYALGAALDLRGWSRRKAVPLARPGAQLLELDAEILARTQPDLADLRLVSDGRQRPFVHDPTPAWRTLAVQPAAADDPKRSAVSRWQLKLPQAGLPITRLTVDTSATLFDRVVAVHESVNDGRGDRTDRVLVETRWRRAPGQPVKPLELALAVRPLTDTLWLEIRNQDNAPLPLGTVTLAYPAPRLRFLAPLSPATWIYYDNSKSRPAAYDLELVAGQLLVAETSLVTAGPEEVMKGGTWQQITLGDHGLWFFWGSLALVVGVLLTLLRRLLPPPTT